MTDRNAVARNQCPHDGGSHQRDTGRKLECKNTESERGQHGEEYDQFKTHGTPIVQPVTGRTWPVTGVIVRTSLAVQS